jgi:hypothetical protein
VTSLSEGYRIGGVFSEISASRRARLGRHAALVRVDRRARSTESGTVRGRLFLPE